MLRFRDSKNPSAGYHYFSKSDAGLEASGLRSEVGGKAAERLGLDKDPDFDQFKNLLHGLHPNTGDQLTAKLVEDRISYWDITASVPKGVTIALERGDSRIHDAIWEAGRETMADIEAMTTTRKRKGGAQEDRVTGNLMWFGFEHPETRPAKADGMPDMDRHIHFVVPNLTYDEQEKEWKAIKFRPVMDLRKFFDRSFDARLASKLADLGYGIEVKHRSDGVGGKRFYTWDIRDMPKSVVEKFSRRTGEVEALAEKLGITGPGKDKLGATSRQYKRQDMTLEDYRRYWDSRVTPEEARAVAAVIQSAMLGQNSQKGSVQEAVEYSLSHNFERQSVVPWHQVAITALERGMGAVTPEQVMPEAKRQGLMVKGGETSTKGVLAEESRVIAFARDGRGTCRAMGNEKGRPGTPERPSEIASTVVGLELHNGLSGSGLNGGLQSDPATISPEQQAVSAVALQVAPRNFTSSALSPDQLRIARHVWDSRDRVILIRGAAGTGKTHTMKTTIAGIDRPVVVLAPSADASRGVLRDEGFIDANTVTRFLTDQQFQQKAKGGVIWIDEAGLLGIRQVRQVFDLAEKLEARVVIQGDKRQHASVERGATLRVLEQFAGLPVAELTEIRRQKGKYKQAVSALSEGEVLKGYDALNELGWVQQTPVFDHNKPLVDDYLAALDKGKDVLAIAPTHVEAEEVTGAIRTGLRERGRIGKEEREIETLRPLHWTEAERGDLERYDGTETLQFHRNGGTFKAGQSLAISDFRPGMKLGKPTTYSVFAPSKLKLAQGDRIRITANGWAGKHRLDNGAQYTIAGFEQDGRIRLTNGWFLPADFKHISHGYVTTSHASQGKTVDKVFIAMGHESLPAVNAEQFYVSVSRGRESATIYTGVSPTVLRAAIQKADKRKSATEVFTNHKRRKEWWLSRKAQAIWQSLRKRTEGITHEFKLRERGYAR